MSAPTQDPDHPDTWLIPDSLVDGRIAHIPTVLKGIHLEAECAGRPCLLHHPSRHHMRRWPLVWVDSQKVFRRMCQHDVAHPDPDGWGPDDHHPCDGCCTTSTGVG